MQTFSRKTPAKFRLNVNIAQMEFGFVKIDLHYTPYFLLPVHEKFNAYSRVACHVSTGTFLMYIWNCGSSFIVLYDDFMKPVKIVNYIRFLRKFRKLFNKTLKFKMLLYKTV